MSEDKKESLVVEPFPITIDDAPMPVPRQTTNKGNATKRPKNKVKIPKAVWWIATAVVVVALIVTVFMLYTGSVKVGADAAYNKYIATYTSQKDKTYKSIYDYWYKKSEEKYHVSNRVTISIEEVEEVEILEVLKVSTTEFIIENGNENKYKITAWLKTTGSGVFTVNLAAAEYIIDDERSYVLVRLPYPKLTNVTIDYANVEKLFFKNDIFNDSKKVGMDEAKKMLDKADVVFKREFSSNETYYINAQKSAVNTIESLIRQSNPNVEGLVVEVDFY